MKQDLASTIEEVINTFPHVTLYDFYFNEHSRTLRVYIDAPDGVDVELCARISAGLSGRLDEADPIAGNYRLEVSSPGIERTLRKPQHYEWARGHVVKVVAGGSTVFGTLLDTDGTGVRIQTEDGLIHLAYSEIRRARVVEPALVKGGRA